jgi:hypothetical protein
MPAVSYCLLAIRCRGSVFTKPLPSNDRLFSLHYPGLQSSCRNIESVLFILSQVNGENLPDPVLAMFAVLIAADEREAFSLM